MLTRRAIFAVLCWILLLPGISSGVVRPAWQLELKESTTVHGGIARLSDLAKGPLPAGLDQVVIVSGGQPGSVKAISHRMILRKLVTNGLAGGVSFAGAKWAQVTFAGSESPAEELRPQIRALIQPMVPAGKQGAPSSWFDLTLPEISFAFQDEIRVSCLNSKTLVPGRNNLRMRAHDDQDHQDFQVIVNLHVSGEIATALVPISKEKSLDVADFQWEWRDLADIDRGLITCREALLACSAATNIKPGHELRQTDVKNTPVIFAGDSVDLCITRGSLEVVVKGVARQAGGLGQVIPVRNSLNGQLVNATVAGQGIVQWRN